MWETIKPWATHLPSSSVSVGLRNNSKGIRPCVTIGAGLARSLGWVKKHRVVVQTDTELGLLRLSLSGTRDGYSLFGSLTCQTLCVAFSMHGMPSTRRRAEVAECRVEDGALIITQPAWMRAGGASVAMPQPRRSADPDAAAPDRRDELEAKQLLRKGTSISDVVREFGFSFATVVGWHESVLAERKGRAA